MSSEKHVPSKDVPAQEDNDMENVALHRAESMISEDPEILDQLKHITKTSPPSTEKVDVYHYVGIKAMSVGAACMKLSVEVVMFMYMFSYIVRSITATNMIMDKVCLVHLGYAEDVCKDLEHHPKIKSEVEKMANNYHLGHSFILMMPSAILSLFIGPWSDKYGRKMPLIVALIGIILDGFGLVICAHYFYSRVEFYFASAMLTGFSGGFISCLMTLYSYASDVTASGKRTMKYAIMEVAFGLSMPLGALAGGWIFKYFGYVPVFITSASGHILGLFWVIFFLEETRGLDNKDSWKQKFVNFWSVESVVSSFKTTIKKRPNKGRTQIWLMMLAMSIAVFSFASLAGIMFFYVHHQYNWENTTYSTISAIYSVIGLAMMLIIVPMSKRFNIGDPTLGIIGSISLVLKNVITGIAFKSWLYHIASIGGLLSSLGTLAGRSRLSKLVSKDDIGKVFAFLTTAESILPIIATAIVSQSFNLTLDFFPGLIFVAMGVLCVIPLGVFIYLARLPAVNYDEMENEVKEETNEITIDEVSVTKY